MTFRIRQLATADYPFVISVIDRWWGGRPMADKLPRLFFEHFTDTSFAAERDGRLAGFLAGFISQSRPGEAYIHFVGVDPAQRGTGLGRLLYETFFQAAEARGAVLVRAVTSPGNRGSIAFHQRMGFQLEPGDAEVDGIPVSSGHDGPDGDRVRFICSLAFHQSPSPAAD
jgi:GNAT superfamily N-acetyltransferase